MTEDETPTGRRGARSFSPAEWRRLEPLVDALLDTPPEQRAAMLAELSGGDPDRRRELEEVLADCERSHPLLDQPAAARFSALADDDAVAVAQVIAERYRITRKLRRGGMATVYLAHDLRHGRDVALKVVRADLAATLGSDRFLREIEIVAGLHHPHIVPLYDSGAADGILYYVMPYEAGQSLRERLVRDGTLSIDDAVTIVRDVCDALVYAHARGIVHRDIKPDNVLLSGRHAMVTDFGVAKALSAAVGADERPDHTESPGAFTTSGVTLGTPAYMAPEQIAGDPRIDHRADIYAVGVLAYEIIAGRPPFQGDDSHDVLAAHLSRAPDPLATHRPDLTPELASLVMRCLEKRAADRWQSADDVLSRLAHIEMPSGGRRVMLPPGTSSPESVGNTARTPNLPRRRTIRYAVVAATVLIALFAGIWQWRTAGDDPAVGLSEPSIAVLPFANLSTDPADASFADRMTEELTTALARAGNVRVAPSTSAARFRNHTLDVRAVAESLGVSSIVEGGFGKMGSRLHMNVRLVNRGDGSIRWAEEYDRAFKDILIVEDELARAVAGELGLRLDRQRQLTRHNTKNAVAYELYLRGSDPVLLRNQAGIGKAQDYFQRAIAADSNYAAAHASLALMYVRRARYANDPGMPTPALLALAEMTARKAIALDDSLAEGHYALAQALETKLDMVSAAAAIQKAIALDPSRSVYRRRLAYIKGWTGPPEAELAEARGAMDVDPLNPYSINAVAGGLYTLGRYDDVLAMLEPLSAMKPPLQGNLFLLAQCYARKGMWAKAIATVRPPAEDGDPTFTALLGYMLAHVGQREEARRILARLRARHEQGAGGAFQIATVYAGLGDRDQVFAWLDKSISDYSMNSAIMGLAFDDLHDDPRYMRLRERLGFQLLR